MSLTIHVRCSHFIVKLRGFFLAKMCSVGFSCSIWRITVGRCCVETWVKDSNYLRDPLICCSTIALVLYIFINISEFIYNSPAVGTKSLLLRCSFLLLCVYKDLILSCSVSTKWSVATLPDWSDWWISFMRMEDPLKIHREWECCTNLVRQSGITTFFLKVYYDKIYIYIYIFNLKRGG